MQLEVVANWDYDEQELEGHGCIACGTYHIVDETRVFCLAKLVFVDKVSEEDCFEQDSLHDNKEDEHCDKVCVGEGVFLSDDSFDHILVHKQEVD